jgi:PAS domain S-box-containing protein
LGYAKSTTAGMTPEATSHRKYKILLLEDHRTDADQITRQLNKAGLASEILVVDSRAKFEESLISYQPEIILSDHNLIKFNSLQALEILKKRDVSLPFILVTGTVSEEFAVEAMRAGVDDYILKDRMQRLPIAIRAVMEKFELGQQQKQAQLKIRESEAKYRAVFENSMDGMLLLITDGKILSANPSACMMFQMTQEELCFLDIVDIIDVSDPRFGLMEVERKKTGHSKGEITFLRKDGSQFPGELTCSVFTDVYGNERTSIIFRDITDRKRAEQNLINTSKALEKALNDLTKVMDSSLDMICAVNEDGFILQISAACQAILGFSPKELIGKRIFDFVYHEDVVKTKESAQEVMRAQKVSNFENRYVRKDGSLVTIMWATRWDPVDRIRYGVGRDATEMKKAERTIASERKRLSDLFMNAPVAMCILKGKDHVFELANPVYLEKTGKTSVTGKKAREVFPELEQQGYFRSLDHVFETGEPLAGNEMLIEIDREGNGELTQLYQNMLQQPYRDANGNVEGIFYFGVDVTDQVVSRKKIEEAEKRYRQIVETAQEGIWVVDEHDKTIFVNNKLCELLEYDRPEMIGKDIYQFMDEDGKKKALIAMKNRRQGDSRASHFKYLSKSGREVWTNISANPLFNELGTYKGSLAMITDITEQKKIESENYRLAMVASLTVNAVIVTDAQGRITWVNKGFERITEFTFEESVGRKPGEFLQGDETDKTNVLLMSHLVKNGEGFRVEIINYSKSGRKYWLDIEVVPLYDEELQLTGFMAIEQDITERKKSQKETLNLIDSLERRNKNLQQFSYIVSHNLRAPISKIMALTNAIENETSENQLLIEKISGEANQLDDIIKDINTIVAARQLDRLEMERVNFEYKVKRVSQLLEDQIIESNAKINTDFSQAPEVITVKTYLFSILYNLISNAIKYRNSSVPLEISISTSKAENFICLEVRDNGLGIDLVKNKDKIFGLYKRFHGNAIPGKGIGLNLVKTHTESLGGKIEIKSKVNEGTAFKIFLPENYENDID